MRTNYTAYKAARDLVIKGLDVKEACRINNISTNAYYSYLKQDQLTIHFQEGKLVWKIWLGFSMMFVMMLILLLIVLGMK